MLQSSVVDEDQRRLATHGLSHGLNATEAADIQLQGASNIVASLGRLIRRALGRIAIEIGVPDGVTLRDSQFRRNETQKKEEEWQAG